MQGGPELDFGGPSDSIHCLIRAGSFLAQLFAIGNVTVLRRAMAPIPPKDVVGSVRDADAAYQPCVCMRKA